MIVPRDPFARVSGASIRVRELAGALAEHGAVDFFELISKGMIAEGSPVPVPAPYGLLGHAVLPRGTGGLRGLVRALLTLRPRQVPAGRAAAKVRVRLRQVLEGRHYDLVLVVREPTLAVVSSVLPSQVPVVVDVDDLSERYLASRLDDLEPLARALSRIDIALWRVQRRRTRRRAAALLATHEDDARRLGPSGTVAPNVYRPAPTRRDSTLTEPRALFVGSLLYEPNVRAVRYLCDEVWPLVRLALPDAELDVVGRTPPGVDVAVGAPGVVVHGEVPSMTPFLEACGVALCPVETGAGTAIKVLEAFAHRIPVVATPFALRGLPAHDVPALVATSPAGFAEHVIEVLEGRSAVAVEAGHRYWAAHHSPAAMSEAVSELLRGLPFA